ncbi:unnamed protein product [Closterium sp. NIES-64]|nr:unnamed protein product [Closterium sp. NIES-64]
MGPPFPPAATPAAAVGRRGWGGREWRRNAVGGERERGKGVAAERQRQPPAHLQSLPLSPSPPVASPFPVVAPSRHPCHGCSRVQRQSLWGVRGTGEGRGGTAGSYNASDTASRDPAGSYTASRDPASSDTASRDPPAVIPPAKTPPAPAASPNRPSLYPPLLPSCLPFRDYGCGGGGRREPLQHHPLPCLSPPATAAGAAEMGGVVKGGRLNRCGDLGVRKRGFAALGSPPTSSPHHSLTPPFVKGG